MHLEQITASTGPPVSLDELRDHLRIDQSVDDADLTGKLRAATEFCQRSVGGHRQFMKATYDQVLDEFPANGRIDLPLPPLKSVTSVKYYDTDNTQQTLSSTAYHTITPTRQPGRVELVDGEAWPTTKVRPDAVKVRFVAGATSTTGVDPTVKQAVYLLVGHWNENREATAAGSVPREIELGLRSLLGANEYGAYG